MTKTVNVSFKISNREVYNVIFRDKKHALDKKHNHDSLTTAT